MGTSVWPWLSFFALVLGLLALDLGIFHRKARAISLGGALWLSLLYIVLALLFAFSSSIPLAGWRSCSVPF
jgi:tellurite resistance protein TerC